MSTHTVLSLAYVGKLADVCLMAGLGRMNASECSCVKGRRREPNMPPRHIKQKGSMYKLMGTPGHKYRNVFLGLSILCLGLLVYDIRMSNSLLVIKWMLYSVLGVK